MDAGIQLNNCGPWTWKDCSLKVLTLCLVFEFIFWIEHFLPALSDSEQCGYIPQFGASPSSILIMLGTPFLEGPSAKYHFYDMGL